MMSVLVFVEYNDGIASKMSLEALCYANKISDEVDAIVFEQLPSSKFIELGKYGVKIVHYVESEKYTNPLEQFSKVIAELMQQQKYNVLITANTTFGSTLSSCVAIKMDASIATNVVDLPDMTDGFIVKQSIYSGKAFANIELLKENKVISINKNACEVEEKNQKAEVVEFVPSSLEPTNVLTSIKKEKMSGDILLTDAEIVVSAGRGLKGPENWSMIEELAKVLGAATACSKPVSDLDWRPHHEHVGQTGIKISPQLYIAIGISGAIQHLAGVNSSKVIVVINTDAEAPFFKSADYGIIGDAFQVVPRLIEVLKST